MLRAAGRQIAKRHKKAQRPHGRQSVKKLMAHGENVNSIEVEAPKLSIREQMAAYQEIIDGSSLEGYRQMQKKDRGDR